MAGWIDRLHHAGFGWEFGDGMTAHLVVGECFASLSGTYSHISYLIFHT